MGNSELLLSILINAGFPYIKIQNVTDNFTYG